MKAYDAMTLIIIIALATVMAAVIRASSASAGQGLLGQLGPARMRPNASSSRLRATRW